MAGFINRMRNCWLMLYELIAVARANDEEKSCSRLQRNLQIQMRRSQLIEDALRETTAILGTQLDPDDFEKMKQRPAFNPTLSPVTEEQPSVFL